MPSSPRSSPIASRSRWRSRPSPWRWPAIPDLEAVDLSSLRYIMWGATPVTESVAADRHGTDRGPVAAGLRCERAARDRVQPGRPSPTGGVSTPRACPPDEVELRVVDLDTGAVLPPGEIGEIQARSPSLMAGYLPEEETAEAIDDGWYRTGDVGWIEAEGWVHLTDRSKEMIKVNGFQVAPAEVEAVLHGHPDVVDCAVFGIPDERAGEVPVAAVQLEPSRPVDEAELTELVAESLATYKHLRHLVVVDEIPRLPSGKVLRRNAPRRVGAPTHRPGGDRRGPVMEPCDGDRLMEAV